MPRVNPIRSAIALITCSFITLILMIVLSNPIGVITGEITEQSTDMGIETKVTPKLDMIKMVFVVVFLLTMISGISIFLLGTHREEFEETRGRDDEFGGGGFGL